MKCPVCGNTWVEDITPHPYDAKTFRCLSCGEYDIVASVYDVGALKALAPSKRKDARFTVPTNVIECDRWLEGSAAQTPPG